MIGKKEYKVVVTGAAPFKENERNPTQNVKAKLPDSVDRPGRTPIKIIKFPIDFRNVITDMDIIPHLWNGDKSVYYPDCGEGKKIEIDAILHLGMNFSESWALEKRARRDGYEWTGDDGVPLPEHNGGKGGRWEGLSDDLKPIFDVDAIAKHVKSSVKANTACQDADVVTSTDAGLLYCEFIYYTSLATLYRRDETARTLFLHHPGKKTTEKDISKSAEVVVSTICSMMDQLEGDEKL